MKFLRRNKLLVSLIVILTIAFIALYSFNVYSRNKSVLIDGVQYTIIGEEDCVDSETGRHYINVEIQ